MKLKEVELKFKSFGSSDENRARMIDSLPAKQRTAVYFRFFEKWSFRRIAGEALKGCPYHTAKANYRHGMQSIANHMQKIEAIVE